MGNRNNILFFSDSTTMLFDLVRKLPRSINVIWIVYYQSVFDELISRGVPKENIEIFPLGFPYFQRLKLLNKLFNKVLYKIFGEKVTAFFLNQYCKSLSRKYNPKLWLADTSRLLSLAPAASPKATVFHSVTYKKHYLHVHNLDYDFLFFPGFYHKERFQQYYSGRPHLPEIKVVGNLKVSQFLKSKKLDADQQKSYLERLGIRSDWPVVMYAPTFDSFAGGGMLPEKFGEPIDRLKQLATFLETKQYNLILKFHHYMYKHFEDPRIKALAERENVHLFNSQKNHDIADSDDSLRCCDILISDTSGISTTGVFMDKKVIFLEPDSQFDWAHADTEKDRRPGPVCMDYQELEEAIELMITSDIYGEKRKQFVSEVFFESDKDAYDLLSKQVVELVAKKS